MNRRSIIFSATLGFIFIFSASARAEIFFANLQGAQEVPPVATNARGYARVFLDEAAGTISFTVVFNNLTSTQIAAHIHAPAPVGMNAGVAINLGNVGGQSGVITGTANITPTQIQQLRQHLGYVNVHSMTFGNGELRGQLGPKRPVDFDGDGRQDYSVLRFPNVLPPAESPITFWNLNSTTGSQGAGPWGNENAGDFPAPGDFDGDGKDDLSIHRAGATAGADSFFHILRSSDGTAQSVRWGINGDQAVARDYDGDGITDMAVFRRGAAVGQQAFWYYRSSRNGFVQVSTPWGTTGDGTTNGDTPVPGDYDGDGRFDIAVYRFGAINPSNTFLILRSSDGAGVFQPWGNFTSDYIVPGDYDGDGKFDLVAVRVGGTGSSPLTWYILQSSNSQTRAQVFGLSSDLPAQGDYDGDARADIGIYRPGATSTSPSFFWVYNSLSNTTSGTQWGLGADFALNTFDFR